MSNRLGSGRVKICPAFKVGSGSGRVKILAADQVGSGSGSGRGRDMTNCRRHRRRRCIRISTYTTNKTKLELGGLNRKPSKLRQKLISIKCIVGVAISWECMVQHVCCKQLEREKDENNFIK